MRKSMKEYNLGIDFDISSFFSAVFHREIRSKSETNPTQIRSRQDRVDTSIYKILPVFLQLNR